MSRKCQFTIPDDVYDRLVAESIRTSRAQAEYVRRGLDLVLPNDSHELKILGFELHVVVRRLPSVLRRIHPRLENVVRAVRRI